MNVSAPPRPLIAPSIIYRPDFICWPSAEAHRGPLAVRSLRRRERRFPFPILTRLPHRVPSALAQPGAPPGALAPRSRGAPRDAVRFRRRDQVEWDAPRDEPPKADAVRLIRLLGLDDRTHPIVSV